ncbi:MAG: Rpn family recombination-promoting nuclease/putative transposase, partial [Fibromonadales bacterium]|nr:Rpn family recombination-promoting nuclease/putative transposase [Fibromonadales bacterium]
MPKKVAISQSELAQTARFASLLLDFTFKRVFTTEECKYLLISLIEAFLHGYLPAKIVDVTLLPNEKINKTRKQRSAVFDLHCKDSEGNRFIIEVQISKQDHFIGRLLFYISQTISGLAKKGKKYNFNYPRVFSLSFLNFEPEPEEKSRKVVEHIGLVNLERSKKRYPHIHIALVMLTRFKKRLEECKT